MSFGGAAIGTTSALPFAFDGLPAASAVGCMAVAVMGMLLINVVSQTGGGQSLLKMGGKAQACENAR
jgi:hypothetical protein